MRYKKLFVCNINNNALEEHKSWTNVFLKEAKGAIWELSAVAAWVDSIFLIKENKNEIFFVFAILSKRPWVWKSSVMPFYGALNNNHFCLFMTEKHPLISFIVS